MKKAVFLDRDGTINVDHGYLYRREDFIYTEGAVEALRILEELGYLLIIVTNQSGIARGYYSEEDFDKLNQWMLRDLAQKGVRVAKTYFCPHYPQGKIERYAVECECSKPGTGMFRKAQKEWDLDMEQSFAVGDRLRDLSICYEYGVQGIWLGGDDTNRAGQGMVRPLWTAENLLQAAEKITLAIRR